jgi:hypothetical protein
VYLSGCSVLACCATARCALVRIASSVTAAIVVSVETRRAVVLIRWLGKAQLLPTLLALTYRGDNPGEATVAGSMVLPTRGVIE